MMEVDEDVVMFEDFLPSQCHKSLYLFNPTNVTCEMQQFVHGKWMLFVTKGQEHDMLWCCVKEFMKTKCTFREIVFAKASTARPNSHAKTQTEGVIMVYCSVQMQANEIVALGERLASTTNYTSKSGKMYYKSEEQSKCGSRANSVTHNNNQTFFCLTVDVPLKLRYDQTQTAQDMQITSQFDVKYGQKNFALKMGGIWDEEKKVWTARDENVWNTMIAYFPQVLSVSNTSNSPKFCVFSLNVWSMNVHVPERMQAILKSVLFHKTDVLMLQEMTCHAFNILNPLLLAVGFITKSKFNSSRRFCEMLYFNTSTFASVHFEQTPLYPKATANREFHHFHAIHKITGKHIAFATAHLETGVKGQTWRKLQFAHLQQYLQDKSIPWIFGGDTNIAYYQDDDTNIKSFTADAWQERGFAELSRGTWNPIENTNIQKYNPEIAPHVGKCRFDRFLFQKNALRVHDFSLSCTEPCVHELFPSDHFAIVAHFSFL